MTEERAKEVLQEQIDKYGQEYDAEGIEALEIAIKALEQQPCEDCVSRKETIEWLKKVTVTDGITFKTGFKQILYDIEQMPSVKPQRPKGNWIEQTDKNKKLYGWFYCSECGAVLGRVDGANYCSECGAEME